MAKRNCGSCRYFREIALGQNGHCTNAQVVTNQGSLVLYRRDELGCRGGWGSDQWEPRGGPTMIDAPSSFPRLVTQPAAGAAPQPRAPFPVSPARRAPQTPQPPRPVETEAWEDDGLDPRRTRDARDALRRARAARRQETRPEPTVPGEERAPMPPPGVGGGVRVIDPPPPPGPVGRREVQEHRTAALNGRFGSDVAMAFESVEDDDFAADRKPQPMADSGTQGYDLGGSVPISRPGQPEPVVWAGGAPSSPPPPATTKDEPVTPGGWLSPTPSPAPSVHGAWMVPASPPIPPVTGQPWQEDSIVSEYMQELGDRGEDVWTGEGWRENESSAIAWSEPIPLEPERTPPPPKRRRSGWLGGLRQRPDGDVEESMAANSLEAAPLAPSSPEATGDGARWGAPPEMLFDDDPPPTTIQMSAAAPVAPDRGVREISMIDPWLDPETTRPVSGRWRDPEFEEEPRVDPATGMMRVCETCRSFRPQQKGRGVCTHAFAFPHTRVVTGKSLACTSSMGSWWSPSDRVWQDLADIRRHGKPTPLLDELLGHGVGQNDDDTHDTP